MSLEHAILGFLNYGPHSGYDLKKVFDTSVQHFWPADQSQIYRTLARLAEKGWAQVELVEQLDRPDRKVYHITPAGRQALREWLSTQVPIQESRSAALIQVFFAGQLPDEQVLAMFERAAERFRAILEAYQELPGQIQSYSENVACPREQFFWLLTLESGMYSVQAQLAWIENVIERIQAGQAPQAGTSESGS
jgi:PadR family transcriptional regulator AphA